MMENQDVGRLRTYQIGNNETLDASYRLFETITLSFSDPVWYI